MMFCNQCNHLVNHSIPEGHPCPLNGCDGEIIHMDDAIYPVIDSLAALGYTPLVCCGGHFWQEEPCTYITVSGPEQFDELPSGFEAVCEQRPNGVFVTTLTKRHETEGLSELEINAEIAGATVALTEWVMRLEPLVGCE